MNNIKINAMMTRVISVIGILVVVSMIGAIYDANTAIDTAITAAVNSTSFLVLPTLLPFGPIIILLGLLFTSGMLIWKAGQIDNSIGYIIAQVVSVITIIVVLSFFPSLIDQFDTALTTVIAAGDTIGELFLGTMLPLLIYLIVAVAPAVTGGVAAYKSSKKGKKSGKLATANAF